MVKKKLRKIDKTVIFANCRVKWPLASGIYKMLVFGSIAIILITIIGISFPQSSSDYQYIDKDSYFNQSTLILSHVIFRHGNRTADGQREMYPKDPYLNETYFPYGSGQLTHVGKKTTYAIGRTLRNRYNEFLGKYYYPEIIGAYSTDYDRTKMSLQLVLAGLFRPNEEQMFEKDLHWQPVPFNYQSRYKDKVLQGVNCKKYDELYKEATKSIEVQTEFHKYRNVFEYISNNTGLNVSRFLDVYKLYFGLTTEAEWGFQLPEWTKIVWPKSILDLAIKEYYVAMTTLDLRRIATGYFLKKVIQDTNIKIKDQRQYGRKLYLYSAHENNIAELLMVLGLFEPHIPNYGAYLILEIHRINGLYGVKIYYENYTKEGPKLLKMPSCEEFCPFEKFSSLVQSLIPPEDLCGI